MAILPEPTWPTEGQQIQQPPSSICSTDTRPHIITGYLLRLLEAHFSDPENRLDPKLRALLWSEGTPTEASGLLIEPYHKYKAVNIQQRPGIYVGRAPVTSKDIALRDRALTHINHASGNLEGVDHIKVLNGSHIVYICAKTDAAAERLSEEVFYFLMEYETSIKKDLKLGEFKVRVLSDVKSVEEEKDNFSAGVKVEWSNAHAWRMKAIAPILRDVRTVDAP